MESLDDLNEPQREAVLHQRGPLLVLAGAGSGKTRVITRRIAYLIRERGVFPWKILAVTFTNKAAKEMRERLQHSLGPEASALTVSTFHSAAAMILRREAEHVGLSRSFVIYDDSDQLSLVKRAIRESGLDPAQANARDILGRIEAEKNAGRLPEQAKPSNDPKQLTAMKIYKAYQNMLRAANAVDFGDLLLQLVELFRVNEEVRLRYQRRFEYVMVDEFQDTNPVQYELLQLLAPAPKSNVCVVGDDDQSIYRWRGADVDNILNFPAAYPGCKVVKLEQNYRSDQTILEAAHAVIARNKNRMDKKLWSARAKGEPLSLFITRDERGEAQTVAQRIHDLRSEGVADYDQMAVFFRTNAQSRVIEETFRLMRVPYVLVSGRSFYDRAEIRDAASYLRLMTNPKSDADFLRIVNTPPRGIGDTTVERLEEYSQRAGISLYEAIEVPERITALGNAAIKRLTAFRDLLERLVEFAKAAPDATSATELMLKITGMLSFYMGEGTDDAMTRAENLKELVTATQEFDRQRAERLGLEDEITGEVLNGPPVIAEKKTGEAARASAPRVPQGIPPWEDAPGDTLIPVAPKPSVPDVIHTAPISEIAEPENEEPPSLQGSLFGDLPAKKVKKPRKSAKVATAKKVSEIAQEQKVEPEVAAPVVVPVAEIQSAPAVPPSDELDSKEVTSAADADFSFPTELTFETGAPLETEVPALQAFLEQISLVGDSDTENAADTKRVSVMTLHSAKGLEFDVVFITGMEEEVFPHRRATGPEASAEDMAEERRLCYVGFTRARRRLFCSFSQSRALFGELRFNPPSRFLSEVPEELFNLPENGDSPRYEATSARPPIVRRREFDGDDQGSRADRNYEATDEFDQSDSSEVRGMRVRHTQFGRGVVLAANGQGPNAKLVVRFESVGEKTVIARFLMRA